MRAQSARGDRAEERTNKCKRRNYGFVRSRQPQADSQSIKRAEASAKFDVKTRLILRKPVGSRYGNIPRGERSSIQRLRQKNTIKRKERQQLISTSTRLRFFLNGQRKLPLGSLSVAGAALIAFCVARGKCTLAIRQRDEQT